MSASCQSVNSKLEFRLINTYAKFESVKELETEILSVELATEPVEIQPKELGLYVVARVQKVSLGVADDKCVPAASLPDILFVVCNDGMAGGRRRLVLPKRGIDCRTCPLSRRHSRSSLALILSVRAEALESSTASILMCPAGLRVPCPWDEGVFVGLPSAMTRMDVFRRLPCSALGGGGSSVRRVFRWKGSFHQSPHIPMEATTAPTPARHITRLCAISHTGRQHLRPD